MYVPPIHTYMANQFVQDLFEFAGLAVVWFVANVAATYTLYKVRMFQAR